jgi:chromosomal replication initiation ATPase DnaA
MHPLELEACDGNASQLQAFNHAYRLVESYSGDGHSLLLMGSCGVGKTHLAVAILREPESCPAKIETAIFVLKQEIEILC